MSLNDSWLIIQDTDWREFLPLFQLDEFEGEPEDPQFGYIELPGGWAALWGGSNRFHGQKELLAASHLGLALRLELNDQVTFLSALAAAKGGEPLWEVVVGEDDKLVLSGSPPLEIDALRALTSRFDELMGGDHDIPPALAKSLSGFDYDDFLGRVRYLEPTIDSPFSPSSPGPIQRQLGRPLQRVMRWWFNCSVSVSHAVSEAITHVVLIILFLSPFMAALFLFLWILRNSSQGHF